MTCHFNRGVRRGHADNWDDWVWPLQVLDCFVYADSNMLAMHPGMASARVMVHFHADVQVTAFCRAGFFLAFSASSVGLEASSFYPRHSKQDLGRGCAGRGVLFTALAHWRGTAPATLGPLSSLGPGPACVVLVWRMSDGPHLSAFAFSCSLFRDSTTSIFSLPIQLPAAFNLIISRVYPTIPWPRWQ